MSESENLYNEKQRRPGLLGRIRKALGRVGAKAPEVQPTRPLLQPVVGVFTDSDGRKRLIGGQRVIAEEEVFVRSEDLLPKFDGEITLVSEPAAMIGDEDAAPHVAIVRTETGDCQYHTFRTFAPGKGERYAHHQVVDADTAFGGRQFGGVTRLPDQTRLLLLSAVSFDELTDGRLPDSAFEASAPDEQEVELAALAAALVELPPDSTNSQAV